MTTMRLYCEQIGEGAPVLLLLHGMAGNGAVWRQFVDVLRGTWPGKILVPDLRGHGRSPQGRHYGYGQHAADVSELLDAAEHVTVVAHSMGAVVALAAASAAYGLSIDSVLGFGVKMVFADADVDKARSLAAVPVRWFDSRREAADRFLRLSGLTGLAPEDSEAVQAGVREENARWRIAADPRTFSAPVPDFDNLFRAAKARVALACGSEDRMVSVEQLRRFDPEAVELPGLGHNLHVQAPQALAELLDRFRR
jgi:pimeloyl-ACP methyl ester carboxylesterase